MSAEQSLEGGFVKKGVRPEELLVPQHTADSEELVIVSARPLDTSGFGGLAATVRAAVDGLAERTGTERKIISIGYGGDVEPGGLSRTLPPLHNGDNFDVVYIPQTPEQQEKGLDGFANRVLWFLCHELMEYPRVDQEALQVFEEQNRETAQAAAHYSKDRILWVHDYQEALVPEFVRELNPEQVIGYFHHIPFPGPDTFRWLKGYGEDVPARFLKSLLASDVVGFQTIDDLQNFCDCLSAFVDGARIEILAPDDVLIEIGGRKICAGAFPIGVHVEGIREEVNTEEVEKRAEEMRRQHPGRYRALNLGRRERAKRLESAVAGHVLALTQHPELQGELTQLLNAPGSRERMPEYSIYTEEIRKAVHEANIQEWGIPGWEPIVYNERGVQGIERAAAWQASEIGFYPTIDGMNVSVLEHVIGRDKTKKLVVVIGRKTGARVRLPGAIIVDPDDIQSVADGLYEAFTMPEDIAMARASDMEEGLERDTVFDWVQKYMERIARIRDLRAQ